MIIRDQRRALLERLQIVAKSIKVSCVLSQFGSASVSNQIHCKKCNFTPNMVAAELLHTCLSSAFKAMLCSIALIHWRITTSIAGRNAPRHEISNNVVCATSNASDQPAHTRSLIRAFAIRLNIR